LNKWIINLEEEAEPPKKELRHLRRGTQMRKRINYKEDDSDSNDSSDSDNSDEYIPKNEESGKIKLYFIF